MVILIHIFYNYKWTVFFFTAINLFSLILWIQTVSYTVSYTFGFKEKVQNVILKEVKVCSHFYFKILAIYCGCYLEILLEVRLFDDALTEQWSKF